MNALTVMWQTLTEASRVAVVNSVLIFIGACFAATLAFVGVAVTNRGHHKRLAIQLAADRDAKRIDREMAFRKEIYSNAVGAAESISQILAKFIDPAANLPDLNTQLNAQTIHIGKVHLVANNATLVHVIGYSSQVAEELFPLMQIRTRLYAQRSKMDSEREHLKWIKKQQTDDEMKGLTSQEHARMAAFWSDHVDKTERKLADLLAESGQQYLAAWGLYIDACERLNAHALPFIRSIRSELGDQDFDGVAYERHLVASVQELRARITPRFVQMVEANPTDATGRASSGR